MKNYHGKQEVIINGMVGKGVERRFVEVPVIIDVSFNKKWTYSFTRKGDDEPFTSVKDNKNAPSTLTPTNAKFFSGVIKLLGIHGKEDIEGNYLKLQEAYDIVEEKAIANFENAIKRSEERKAETIAEYSEKGKQVFLRFKENHTNVPQYITSLSRWLIAKEEANVIKFLLAVMNTARGEATDIIQESASASGKSAIENAGFSLVHDHHHMILNFATSASFRNVCKDNPTLFKNKVIRLGDLGTEANEDVIKEVMGILKILNSEGQYIATKTANDNETVIEIRLEGRCAKCFSKVPNDSTISDQDTSRGVLITPNPYNDEDFKWFMAWKTLPDMKGQKELIDDYLYEIRNYIEYVIQQDIQVINPYFSQLNDILKHNKSYRRKLTKELWLMESLALLNLPNKKIYEKEGIKLIYVSVEDLMNYMSLYKTDLIANSNFDSDVHGENLYQRLNKDYKAIPDYESEHWFEEELANFGLEEYDESAFRNSKYFFTITGIMDIYNGNKVLTNLISEKKGRARNDKIRDTLQGMPDKIGRYNIPEAKFPGLQLHAPTLYFILDIEQSNIFNSVQIRKKAFYMLADMGLELMIEDIWRDFKNTPYQIDHSIDDEMGIIIFDSNYSQIMEHHSDIEKPPMIHISEEVKEKVDEKWDKFFAEMKTPIDVETDGELYNRTVDI